MADVTKINLKHPITVRTGDKEEVVSEVSLRRPKLKDLRGLDLDRITGDLVEEIICRIAGIPKTVAGEIDPEDLEDISKVIEGFFGRFQGTGVSS